jgi:hypothetical protein
MGADDYEGEFTGNFLQSIKAHGKGKISYKSGLQYTAVFDEGKMELTGDIQI